MWQAHLFRGLLKKRGYSPYAGCNAAETRRELRKLLVWITADLVCHEELERFQRMRLGQLVAPPIKVQLTG
jgi:hypothetical protein